MRAFDVYNLRNKRGYVLNDLLLKDVMPETSSLNMILFYYVHVLYNLEVPSLTWTHIEELVRESAIC